MVSAGGCGGFVVGAAAADEEGVACLREVVVGSAVGVGDAGGFALADGEADGWAPALADEGVGSGWEVLRSRAESAVWPWAFWSVVS